MAAWWFYAQQSVESLWSVRELHHQIERKAFHRTELAAFQTNTPVQAEPVVAANTVPALVFKDPYFLDFLGLRQGHDEADLEAARVFYVAATRATQRLLVTVSGDCVCGARLGT